MATFLLANAGGAIALLHGIRGVNRVVAELDEDPDPLYPATLLAFGHGFADWKVTGWAAVHRAARDHDSQHPLTVLGRGATDAAEIIEGTDFYQAHQAEVNQLAARLPGRRSGELVTLSERVYAYPAFLVSAWIALYGTAAAVLSLIPADGPADDEDISAMTGAAMCGAVAWILLLAILVGLQAALWRLPYRSWDRRRRARAAGIVRRELGDSYDAYLADVRREESALVPAVLPAPAA